jgi:hypothetical protein
MLNILRMKLAAEQPLAMLFCAMTCHIYDGNWYVIIWKHHPYNFHGYRFHWCQLVVLNLNFTSVILMFLSIKCWDLLSILLHNFISYAFFYCYEEKLFCLCPSKKCYVSMNIIPTYTSLRMSVVFLSVCSHRLLKLLQNRAWLLFQGLPGCCRSRCQFCMEHDLWTT